MVSGTTCCQHAWLTPLAASGRFNQGIVGHDLGPTAEATKAVPQNSLYRLAEQTMQLVLARILTLPRKILRLQSDIVNILIDTHDQQISKCNCFLL